VATAYDELIVDQLDEGKRQLEHSLTQLVEMAEKALNLWEKQRARTVLRVDAGGGSEANINWMLTRGYGVLIKIHNWQRVRKLISTATDWSPIPTFPRVKWGGCPSPMPMLNRHARSAYANAKVMGRGFIKFWS
jgi:hypothetical protein